MLSAIGIIRPRGGLLNSRPTEPRPSEFIVREEPPMRHHRTLLSAVVGLGLAATFSAVPDRRHQHGLDRRSPQAVAAQPYSGY